MGGRAGPAGGGAPRNAQGVILLQLVVPARLRDKQKREQHSYCPCRHHRLAGDRLVTHWLSAAMSLQFSCVGVQEAVLPRSGQWANTAPGSLQASSAAAAGQVRLW